MVFAENEFVAKKIGSPRAAGVRKKYVVARISLAGGVRQMLTKCSTHMIDGMEFGDDCIIDV